MLSNGTKAGLGLWVFDGLKLMMPIGHAFGSFMNSWLLDLTLPSLQAPPKSSDKLLSLEEYRAEISHYAALRSSLAACSMKGMQSLHTILMFAVHHYCRFFEITNKSCFQSSKPWAKNLKLYKFKKNNFLKFQNKNLKFLKFPKKTLNP